MSDLPRGFELHSVGLRGERHHLLNLVYRCGECGWVHYRTFRRNRRYIRCLRKPWKRVEVQWIERLDRFWEDCGGIGGLD